MKGIYALTLTLVTLAQAATTPNCAIGCVTDAMIVTGCSPSDTKCICSSEAFTGSIEHCWENKCNGLDHDSLVSTTTEFCSATDVDVAESFEPSTELKKRDPSWNNPFAGYWNGRNPRPSWGQGGGPHRGPSGGRGPGRGPPTQGGPHRGPWGWPPQNNHPTHPAPPPPANTAFW